MQSFKNALLFLSILFGTFVVSESYIYLNRRPQGPHQWRQSDCTSFTLNYAEDDLPFLEPAIHEQISDGFTTGKTVGEFPLLYYFVGQVWKVTGQNEGLYRVINLSIFCLGLLALFRAIHPYIKHKSLAYLLAALPLSIPILAFYAPNFLQNSTALSMVFIAWSFVSKFIRNPKNSYALLAILFFTLAGLLKITALISFLALLGTIGLDLLWKFEFQTVFKTKKRAFAWLAGSTTIVLGTSALWYKMAVDYCDLHNGRFTFNGLWPIWESSPEHMQSTFDKMMHYWTFEYFTGIQYALLVLAIFYMILSLKKVSFFEKGMTALLIIGNTSYMLLWFHAIRDHDYYYINLYALPVFLLFVLFRHVDLSKHIPQKWSAPLLWIFTLLVLSWSASSTSKSFHSRYNGSMNDGEANRFASFFDITPTLRNDYHIKRTDPVLTFPDRSFNISLYLSDQKGWAIRRDSTVSEFKFHIKHNHPKYLLVNDTAFFNEMNFSSSLPIEKIGNHKSVDIYSIKYE